MKYLKRKIINIIVILLPIAAGLAALIVRVA